MMSCILKQKILMVGDGGETDCIGHKGTFFSDGHCLFLDWGGSFTGIDIIITHPGVHLKCVHFILCKL